MKKPQIKHTIQGDIEFRFPYNRFAVNSVKKIPANLRRWEPKSKCWIVAASQEPELVRICQFHFNNEYNIIGKPQKANAVETKMLKIKYIGQPKDRGDGQETAFACDFSDDWNVVFSKDVLKHWFECGIGGIEDDKPKTAITTYYALLAIAKNATGTEIKKAYRKAVRRYHPDVNSDEDAHEMFLKVQQAYETLKNPLQRRKYDASLLFAADVGKKMDTWDYQFTAQNTGLYRPPLRCGWIMATGKNEVGRFVVSKILKWEPIMKNGLELVTSWDAAMQGIKQEWI